MYSGSGNEDFFEPAVAITHNDGNPSTWLYYVSSSSHPVDGGVQTDIVLRDDKYPVNVTLHYVAYVKDTLMGNNGQWIEVQIRSERMNDVAEQGFAAHWKYKEGGGSEDEGELEKWLKTIKEILDDPQPDAIDFLDTIKLNLFASEIFVFTPKGELRPCLADR